MYLLQLEARRLQSQAVKEGVFALARGLAWLGRRASSALCTMATLISEAQAARRSYEQFLRLNDRELADLGLTRDNIPAVITGTFRLETDNVVRKRRDISEEAFPPMSVEQRYRKAA
jgi:uncharacterized protein YjiS (DUF1127 family)